MGAAGHTCMRVGTTVESRYCRMGSSLGCGVCPTAAEAGAGTLPLGPGAAAACATHAVNESSPAGHMGLRQGSSGKMAGATSKAIPRLRRNPHDCCLGIPVGMFLQEFLLCCSHERYDTASKFKPAASCPLLTSGLSYTSSKVSVPSPGY